MENINEPQSEPSQSLAWRADEYGTSILHLSDDAYVWIQGRRPYCDRGHWEWGSVGVMNQGDEPSYYFMTQSCAREQVERWLAPRLGLSVPDPDNTTPENGALFFHPGGAAEGWRWAKPFPNRLLAIADTAVLELNWDMEDPSTGVVLTASGIEHLDASDCFPRRYMGVAAAVKEVEEFLLWRLRQQPAEIPGPLNHAPLDPVLLPTHPPQQAPTPRSSPRPR